MARAKTINIREAKTQFSKLLRKVARGEEVVISRAGKPVARLSPIKATLKERVPGDAKGLFVVPADFNAPLPPEIQRCFEREAD